MASPSAPNNERLEQIAVSSVASLLIAVAGIVGLKQPEITLWAIFFAGACYTFAIHKDLKFENRQTIAIIAALFIASVSTQIWLITRHNQHQKNAGSPSKVVGDATTNAAGSVANTGTIGSVNITRGDDDTAPSKNPTPNPK